MENIYRTAWADFKRQLTNQEITIISKKLDIGSLCLSKYQYDQKTKLSMNNGVKYLNKLSSLN
jgi:hypothetical protein